MQRGRNNDDDDRELANTVEEEEEEEGRFSKEGRRIFPRDKGKGGMAPNRERGRAEMQQL